MFEAFKTAVENLQVREKKEKLCPLPAFYINLHG